MARIDFVVDDDLKEEIKKIGGYGHGSIKQGVEVSVEMTNKLIEFTEKYQDELLEMVIGDPEYTAFLFYIGALKKNKAA